METEPKLLAVSDSLGAGLAPFVTQHHCATLNGQTLSMLTDMPRPLAILVNRAALMRLDGPDQQLNGLTVHEDLVLLLISPGYVAVAPVEGARGGHLGHVKVNDTRDGELRH